MITKIELNSVASYKTEISIDTNAKINLFYGLNGSGKTTISRFLSKPTDLEFNKCTLYPVSINTEKKIIIYNQDYIDENFHQNLKQQGIFTIGQDAIEAEKKLEEIEVKSIRVSKNQKKLNTKIELNCEDEESKKQVLQNWLYKEFKQKYERTDLSRSLKGNMGTKKLFWEKVKNTVYKPNLNYTFKDLLRDEKELQKNKGKSLSFFPTLDVTRLEPIIKNTLWETSYINSGMSNLNSIINALGNLSWVQHGMDHYLKDDQEVCPFCQETLPANFSDNIKKVFDDSYKAAQASIDNHKLIYLESVLSVKNRIKEISQLKEFAKYIDSSFNLISRELYEIFDVNEKLILKKQEDPSLSISLLTISQHIEKLNLLVFNANKSISEFNDRIAEFSISEQKITDQFWELIRYESNSKLEEYEAFYLKISKKKALYKIQLSRWLSIAETFIKQKNIELSKTTNAEESKDRINRRLQSLGIEGFSLEVVEGGAGNMYRIVRPETDEFIFKTLSEGEKTIITFIYFLESVLGVDPEDGSLNLKDRIVVIDDPISSLSHNYIYDVARLIKNIFIKIENTRDNKGKQTKKNRLIVNQLFILTHSLYFFHELMIQGLFVENSRKLFRVIKNKSTKIISISKNDIQNSYQEYWTIFKRSTEDNIFVSVLPNVMRNILEEFFSFIHKRGELKEILEELSDQDNDFMPLERYVNRESHSDLVNLTLFKEISSTKYREMFRRIFDKSGYLNHYETMMEN